MATQTTNYHLVKPAYSDTADIADINGNMDIIDGQMKTNADDVSSNSDAIAKNEAGLAIIVTGDSCTQAVPAGGYAYIKNNTHGLAEGLYKNKSSISFPTSGGTANSTVFEAVSDGIANALNSKLTGKANSIELDIINTGTSKERIIAMVSTMYSTVGTSYGKYVFSCPIAGSGLATGTCGKVSSIGNILYFEFQLNTKMYCGYYVSGSDYSIKVIEGTDL